MKIAKKNREKEKEKERERERESEQNGRVPASKNNEQSLVQGLIFFLVFRFSPALYLSASWDATA